MYNEMTIADLMATAQEKAHPNEEPSAEHAALIDELVSRLSRLSVWRERMTEALNPHLREDDGSDLTPDHVRVSNMLERISSADEAGLVGTGNPGKPASEVPPSPQPSAPETDAIMSVPDRGSGWLVAVKLEKLARRLEPQLAEALSALRDIEEYGTEEINAAVELRQKLASTLIERDNLKEDLEFRRGLSKLQEEQLDKVRIERDEALRDLGEARVVLGKATRFVEAFEPKSMSAEADQRETLESLNSFLNPDKKVSSDNGVPESKNDPATSAEGNTPSERFPRGLTRQPKVVSPVTSDGKGHGVTS